MKFRAFPYFRTFTGETCYCFVQNKKSPHLKFLTVREAFFCCGGRCLIVLFFSFFERFVYFRGKGPCFTFFRRAAGPYFVYKEGQPPPNRVRCLLVPMTNAVAGFYFGQNFVVGPWTWVFIINVNETSRSPLGPHAWFSSYCLRGRSPPTNGR